MHPRAGQPAQPEDLIDTEAVITAYYETRPDPTNPDQQVAFGTSGHRGSSLDATFNQDHVAAIAQAICEYRSQAGITGPLVLGKDTHALSGPAWETTLEVLAANNVTTLIEAHTPYTPTPAVSLAILRLNGQGSAPSPISGGNIGQADGIILSPSHNPPRDGGLKYNPPHGGPAEPAVTSWIAERANQHLREGLKNVRRNTLTAAKSAAHPTDLRDWYVSDLPTVLDLNLVRDSGLRIGADPLGGASIDYWTYIAEQHRLALTVLNPQVDPQWSAMTLDHDGKIRMDCSSPNAMASLVRAKDAYDLTIGNDADADRHGVVTPDGGLVNPNHMLAVSVQHLAATRKQWSQDAQVGATIVTSAMVGRAAAGAGFGLLEVPVGFRWFVPGLQKGAVCFGGEESAGASFLRHDGTVWTTDKDGLLLCLLAAEMTALDGRTPSQRYRDLTQEHGAPAYSRVDAPATRQQREKLSKLEPSAVTADSIAGEAITARLTHAPGNGAAIGGLKVCTENAWFAARPSGTEDIYKVYAESFLGDDHLAEVLEQAQDVVTKTLSAG